MDAVAKIKNNLEILKEQRQKFLFPFVGVILLIVLLRLFLFTPEPSVETPSVIDDATSSPLIKTVIQPINTQKTVERIWNRKLEEDLERLARSKDEERHRLEDQIRVLGTEFATFKRSILQEVSDVMDKVETGYRDSNNNHDANYVTDEYNQSQSMPRIKIFQVALEKEKDEEELKTTDNYIPANTIARGVLLTGVDISTSSITQSDPEPVQMLITDNGTLPRYFESDLKECKVLGSTYGDLSSERAKIRLETLSCVEIDTGEVIETSVKGFVTGEDGKSGLQGEVVSMDGPMVARAMIGALFGGAGDLLGTSSAEYNPITLSKGIVQPKSFLEKLYPFDKSV